MRTFTHLMLAAVATACAQTPAPRTPMDLAPHPDVEVQAATPAMPQPQFVTPYDWSVISAERQDEASIAEVMLVRPVMDGRMLLAIVPADGLTPREQAEQVRETLVELMPDALFSEVSDGLDGPNEAAFVGLAPRDAPRGAPVRRVKMIFREIPGHPKYLAMCQGFWPQDSHEFLLAPLHEACNSVRPPK